jgi:hypothetical protein
VNPRLQLPDVTLVVVDTICHQLAALAIKECLEQAQFGAVHIHTDDRTAFQHAGIDAVFIAAAPFASLNEVMDYLWYQVPLPLETSHALIMQWDSGIVSPAQWSGRFLEYDYVGAPWGWHGDDHEVGNGGFSLRSRRLLRYLAEHRQEFPLNHPEDDRLCRRYRPALERAGFRWASIDLALQFSFERSGFSGLDQHFGYHGIFNWPRVFSVAALHERIQLMLGNPYLNQPKHLLELLEAVKDRLAETEPGAAAVAGRQVAAAAG